MKDQVGQMQEKMRQQQQNEAFTKGNVNQASSKTSSKPPSSSDYIDFEEVK